MPLRIAAPRDAALDRGVLQDLERAVHDVLGEPEAQVDVRFGAWRGEDGRLRYFCKVESPPAGPFAEDVQWRWWSPLVEGPDELREALRTAAARRRRSAAAGSRDVSLHAEAAPA